MVYEISNESLQAVVTGLDVQPSDGVLAVAGSGDQAFALLETAERVIVADISLMQLEIMKRRVAALKHGDYAAIMWEARTHSLETEGVKIARNSYFTEAGRLERIANRLDRLVILGPADIAEAALLLPKGLFNKVYLSNVMGSSPEILVHGRGPTSFLATIASTVPSGGLIYSAVDTLALPEKELVIDGALTSKAQRLERDYRGYLTRDLCWMPTVYRKK